MPRTLGSDLHQPARAGLYDWTSRMYNCPGFWKLPPHPPSPMRMPIAKGKALLEKTMATTKMCCTHSSTFFCMPPFWWRFHQFPGSCNKRTQITEIYPLSLLEVEVRGVGRGQGWFLQRMWGRIFCGFLPAPHHMLTSLASPGLWRLHSVIYPPCVPDSMSNFWLHFPFL